MLILVTYDVNVETPDGRRRLRRVAKLCVNYGQRVQNSVFEILLDNARWIKLKEQLQNEVDSQKDSLRYYYLGNHWHSRVEHYGTKPSYDPEGLIII